MTLNPLTFTSVTLPVSNCYLGSYEPGGFPAPLREASPSRNRVAVGSARRSTLAQAKMGQSDAFVEPAIGWAWFAKQGEAQGAGDAS